MRRIEAMIQCLSISAVLFFSSFVYGEPADHSKISFSVPYNCETTKGNRTRCLSDGFKPGLNAVLLSTTGVCRATTADQFTDKYYYDDFKATRLSGNESCFTIKEDERFFTSFDIAIVGADPTAVKLVTLKDDKSPVPKEIEVKARKLAVPHMEEPRRISDMKTVPVTLSSAQPKVLRAANVTLLTFELLADGTPWEPGPTVALTNGKLFLLDGSCTYGEPTLFSVNDKLYLTYTATVGCCGCGEVHFFVYDFSSGTPKKVYDNYVFAD